ncbi:Zinc protease PQQL [Seminavis robusta]|uniref:Zinc protease PQQL n=1 Tax=Seminavis robusta TaxID=568900 RepID=A0A9N8EBB4_9STRA|nr:Zinc protease PQQL [Seminavis robusta]|eukprot:Sro842_g209720.1 Zinc protease PQQL (333) ;mRNA; f:29288-30300
MAFDTLRFKTTQPLSSSLELRLHVDVGSLHEANGEEGIAHYLEHMAFQSLRSYSGDELFPLMQRLGIDAFGKHSNAYTDYTETVYRLSLPDTDHETITACFTLMRDYTDGMLLLESELEIEMGVVLSELQDTETVEDQFSWSFPDYLISKRWLIGLEESIQKFIRQQFLDFYQDYYIPRRTTLIVVGDMNATSMEDLITKFFDSMEDAGPLGKPVEVGNTSSGKGLRTAVFEDEGLEGDELYLEVVKPGVGAPDSAAGRIERIQLHVCNRIASERLQSYGYDDYSAISWGGAYIDSWYNIFELGAIWVAPQLVGSLSSDCNPRTGGPTGAAV